MEAIVLAGGRGTRLRPVVSDLPKPMAPVAGKPFLWYVLHQLETQGFERICLSTGFLAHTIRDYFGNSFGHATLTYSHEETPLGTGGAILQAVNQMAPVDSVFILNGDTFLGLDARAMYMLQQARKASFTIAVTQVSDAARYGALDVEDGLVVGMAEKKRLGPALISAGVYLIDPEYLRSQSYPTAFSFEELVVRPAAEQRILHAFVTEGYFIDIGIPEDYLRAQTEMSELD